MDALTTFTQIYLLGLGRVGSLILLAPVLGGKMVPGLVKVLLSLCLTAFCLHLGPETGAGRPVLSWFWFALLLGKEIVVGWAMGMLITLVVAGCQAAGELAAFQMTLSASQSFFPMTQENGTSLGDFFYILALLVFVMLDGHHVLIRGLDASFRVLPVWGWPGDLGNLQQVLALMTRLLVTALQLSMPVMAALLAANLGLGLLARTMPQINLFVVGLPIQIAVGFLVLIGMMGALVASETRLFDQWSGELRSWIYRLASQ